MKNKAAQELGRRGGKDTAKRGSEYFKKLQKLSVKARKRKK